MVKRPVLYVLVGVPGSGKSTWAETQDWKNECAYVSTDKIVEHYAESVGKTYSEVFDEYMPTAVKLMTEEVVEAREKGLDIIWDQTSTTKKSRARKIRMLHNYFKIAVVFKTPEHDELQRRISNRPGKYIPEHVMKSMVESFEEVSLDEGFDLIWIGS